MFLFFYCVASIVTFDPHTYPLSPANPEIPFVSRSITHGRLTSNPSTLPSLLRREFDDVSIDLSNRLTGQIEHARGTPYDKDRFRQVFLIKKHILSDGVRKIVNINVKQQIVPKNDESGSNGSGNVDLGMKALLFCILFLLAGLVFTTTVKMYQNVVKTNNYHGGVKT